ncbi:hypothetical protein EXIGLDRAFT_835089 [Exidia glandulosa HHB12029]|uniref:F-box domain-containing protein n=1 Tax=Exidia glandulosa HHB12029 TaxID=1314781 RepID=A0A165J4D5_EXIGL|nr:hypothetical protein EXIGLDRAFT_835089 [Exidia glandulosa HHB12029]
MLTPTHDRAVEACLRDVFRDLAHGVHSASQVHTIFTAVMEKSLRVLCDELLEWNASSILQRVPPEILASCLQFLPLPERVRASHVSRHWRSVALAFPPLWGDIIVRSTTRSALALLDAVLPRSGLYPVDFAYFPKEPGASGLLGEIASVLHDHMHHMRTIEWPGSSDYFCFSQPAPMLEIVRFNSDSSLDGSIPDTFLGATAGRLRTLQMEYLGLPQERCPALSTVTRLRGTLPWKPAQTADLRNLFDLFPNVKHLHLRDFHRRHKLPSSPAPSSLEFLVIEASGAGIDFSAVMDGWAHERVRRIDIRAHTLRGDGFAAIMSQVQALDVTIEPSIVFKGSSDTGFTRTVQFGIGGLSPSEFNAAIASHVQALHAAQSISLLKSLTLPLSIWARLIMLPITFPALTEVTLRLPGHDDYGGRDFNFHELRVVLLQLPMLQSMVAEARADYTSIRDIIDDPILKVCQGLMMLMLHAASDHGRRVNVILRCGSEEIHIL